MKSPCSAYVLLARRLFPDGMVGDEVSIKLRSGFLKVFWKAENLSGLNGIRIRLCLLR